MHESLLSPKIRMRLIGLLVVASMLLASCQAYTLADSQSEIVSTPTIPTEIAPVLTQMADPVRQATFSAAQATVEARQTVSVTDPYRAEMEQIVEKYNIKVESRDLQLRLANGDFVRIWNTSRPLMLSSLEQIVKTVEGIVNSGLSGYLVIDGVIYEVISAPNSTSPVELHDIIITDNPDNPPRWPQGNATCSMTSLEGEKSDITILHSPLVRNEASQGLFIKALVTEVCQALYSRLGVQGFLSGLNLQEAFCGGVGSCATGSCDTEGGVVANGWAVPMVQFPKLQGAFSWPAPFPAK